MMFTTGRLSTRRTRNQTKGRCNCVPYVHVLVTLRVPLRVLQLVDIQEFVAPCSYKRPFQIVSFVLLLLPVISSFIPFIYKLLLDVEDLPLFPGSSSFYHYDAIRLPILD